MKEFCKRGHARTPENLTNIGACITCDQLRKQTDAYKAQTQKYKQSEEYKLTQREYMLVYNKSEAGRQRAAKHNKTAKGKQSVHKYKQTEKGKIACANSLSRWRNAVGEVSPEEWKIICACTNDCCACCGLNRQVLRSLGRVLSVDHIVPLSRGGTNWADNVQPLCFGVAGCNNRKSNKTINYLKYWKDGAHCFAAAIGKV